MADSLHEYVDAWEMLQKMLKTITSLRSGEKDIQCKGKIVYTQQRGQNYISEVIEPADFKGLQVFSSFMELKKVKDLAVEAMKGVEFTPKEKISGPQFKEGDLVTFRLRLSLQGLDLALDANASKKAAA